MDRVGFLGRLINAALIGAIALFCIATNAYSTPPVISEVLVTDVTDRSFSIVWATDQVGQPQVDLYFDELGTTPVQNPQINFYPVVTGDPFALNRQISRDEISQAAQTMGIVKATVSGLAPDTDYYVKPGFETTFLESTSCPDSGSVYCPGIVGLPSVRTATAQTRIYNPGTEQLFENDQLLILDENVELGELLVIGVENAKYPVTVFAGDGIPLPYQIIDLNNLYNQEFSMRVQGGRESSMGNHGEALIVRRYKGNSGNVTELKRMGDIIGQGALVEAVPVSLGDCNGDTRIDGYDIFVIEHFLGGTFTSQEFTAVAFHPVLCNLYTEEGRHSVKTTVNIDLADQDHLRSLLIGTISSQDLPVQP